MHLSGSHIFLVVTHTYVSQATHEFLGMLPLCLLDCLAALIVHEYTTCLLFSVRRLGPLLTAQGCRLVEMQAITAHHLDGGPIGNSWQLQLHHVPVPDKLTAV